ncbi:hypothetical protein ACQ1Q7_00550, partial [Ornithobacterium rhinotracheale]
TARWVLHLADGLCTSKFVGVYLDVSDAYSHAVCELEPGQEYHYAGTGPFLLYDAEEEIKGVE